MLAIVHISTGDAQGVVMRHLCLQCAADEDNPAPRERALNHAAIAIVIGSFILTISLFADELRFGSSEGFGYKQITGIALAGVLLFAGAILQIPTVAVVGVLMGGIGLLADWLAFGCHPGFGMQQVMGTVLGTALVVVGWVMARRKP